MKLKPILMAGVATAALSGAIMTSALAADDQVEETRALNLQALADARSENGSTMPMPMPMPKPPTTTDDKRGKAVDPGWRALVLVEPDQLGEPSEVGDACAFLCSAQAGFISGQNLQLDGGSYPGLL